MTRSRRGPTLLFALFLASALVLLPAWAAGQSGKSSQPETHTVTIRQMHFDPPQLTVRAGETVEWRNEDIFAHTATANDGSFDSPLITPGGSWKTTVTHAGDFAYHCRPHPNMIGTIAVVSSDPRSSQPTNSAANGPASLMWSPPRFPQQIHPILVNFTAALLPLSLLSDILGRVFRRKSLHGAAWWLIVYEAGITPLTAAAGWWWKHSAGPTLPPNLITVHQWLGTAAAGLFLVLAVWRWSIHKREGAPNFAYLASAFVAVLALVYQGSLGGTMVFGR
jgi:plastocyanin/uncharacterized membrane protein